MRPYFEALADDGDVDVNESAATLGQERMRVLNEFVRRCIAPIFVTGREVLADIAGAEGSKDSVRGCVERDIGVGMTLEALGMEQLHAAEGNVITRPQTYERRSPVRRAFQTERR